MAASSVHSITSFDELNRLVGLRRSLPFERYFGEMKISDEQKRKRIELANRLEDEFLYILSLLFYSYPTMPPYVADELRDRYEQVLESLGIINDAEISNYIYTSGLYGDIRQHLRDHCEAFAFAAMATTMQHQEDPYFYSEDRAKYMAEDQANYIYDNAEFYDAVEDGMMFKTWETAGDERVRNSHAEVEGLTIPIDEPFMLEGGMLMVPHDDSLGCDSNEIVGCRCSVSYS